MPTPQQKKAFEEVVNGSKISHAMKKAGYSDSTSKRTNKLTKTKGWLELVDKFLPEKHLAKKHREFLDAPRIVRTYKKGDLEIETEETDANAVRALDMAYKIKGSYSAQKHDLSFSEEDRKTLEDIVDAMK